MRLEISIPDPVYTNAQRVAEEMGVSFDRFVSDAIEVVADDYDGPEPTPELIVSLRQADADISAGKGLTMAQVEQSLAAKKAAWLQANPH